MGNNTSPINTLIFRVNMLGKRELDTNMRILSIDDKNVTYYKEIKGNNTIYNDFTKKYKDYWDRLFNSTTIVSLSQQDEQSKKKYDEMCLAFQAIKLVLEKDENFFKMSIPTDQCEVSMLSEEENKKKFKIPVNVIIIIFIFHRLRKIT